MGKIADNVKKAFEKLEAGNFKGFVKLLIDTADHNVKYQWHRDILDREVRKYLNGR